MCMLLRHWLNIHTQKVKTSHFSPPCIFSIITSKFSVLSFLHLSPLHVVYTQIIFLILHNGRLPSNYAEIGMSYDKLGITLLSLPGFMHIAWKSLWNVNHNERIVTGTQNVPAHRSHVLFRFQQGTCQIFLLYELASWWRSNVFEECAA